MIVFLAIPADVARTAGSQERPGGGPDVLCVRKRPGGQVQSAEEHGRLHASPAHIPTDATRAASGGGRREKDAGMLRNRSY